MQITNRTIRLIADLIVLGCIVWGYWWVTLILAIAFLFMFPDYYEIIFWGIAYDTVYGVPLAEFYNFPYVFTGAAITVFIIAFFLKKYLLVYDK